MTLQETIELLPEYMTARGIETCTTSIVQDAAKVWGKEIPQTVVAATVYYMEVASKLKLSNVQKLTFASISVCPVDYNTWTGYCHYQFEGNSTGLYPIKAVTVTALYNKELLKSESLNLHNRKLYITAEPLFECLTDKGTIEI